MSAQQQPNTLSSDNAGVIAPPPLIFAAPLLAGLLVHKLLPRTLLPRRAARLIGWPLVAVGLVVNASFVVTMKRARTPMDPRQPVAHLVTSGPFRFSRNPAYLSLAMLYAGIASLVNALWPILLLPDVIFVMQRGVIEREERYLERTFGAAYLDYKMRVRRWL